MAASSTSITVRKFTDFRQSATEREQLGCKKVPGFFLLKLRGGSAWRLRFTDLLGKRRTATIADGEVKPEQAAQIALEWRGKLKEGITHKAIRRRLRRQRERHKNAQTLSNTRLLDSILSRYTHPTSTRITAMLATP